MSATSDESQEISLDLTLNFSSGNTGKVDLKELRDKIANLVFEALELDRQDGKLSLPSATCDYVQVDLSARQK